MKLFISLKWLSDFHETSKNIAKKSFTLYYDIHLQ